jgi:hypothetical protein
MFTFNQCNHHTTFKRAEGGFDRRRTVMFSQIGIAMAYPNIYRFDDVAAFVDDILFSRRRVCFDEYICE